MFRIRYPLPSRRELERQYEAILPELETVLLYVQRSVHAAVQEAGLTPSLKYRVKGFDSYYEKLLRRSREHIAGETVEISITDLLGVRVVCPFMEDLTRVEEIITAEFEVVEVERKGANLASTEFGYSSVHLLIRPSRNLGDLTLRDDVVCEIQLRTILQDAWAEVEHELVYKAELTPLDGQLRRKLAALNANLTLSDIIFQEIREYQRAMNRSLMRRREDFWTLLQGNGNGPREQGDADDATIHTGSDTIDSMLIKALHAHNDKEYETAERLYTDILAYQPPEHVAAVIHAHRGMTRFALDKLDDAVADFGATISLAPQNTRAYYYRAVVHRVMGRDDEALSDLSRCLEFDPYNIESRIARARLYADLHDHEAARADCRMAAKLDPDHEAVQELCRELGEEVHE